MHELANQKLSQYLDNELSGEETLELLKQLKKQPDLDEKIRRYHIVSQVIRNESPTLANTDFVQSVNQAVAQEVTYLLPKRRQSRRTIISGLAIAASFVIVAVIINHQAENTDKNQDVLHIADNQQNGADNQVVAHQLQPMNSRFNEYLHAHRGSLYIAEPAAHPYAKLVGYGK